VSSLVSKEVSGWWVVGTIAVRGDEEEEQHIINTEASIPTDSSFARWEQGGGLLPTYDFRHFW